MKASKGNNRIFKSKAFHNVGAAYTKDLSKNELAHVLLIVGTHNKQGSKDARVRIVVGEGGVSWRIVSHIDNFFNADYLYSTNEIVFCR